MRARAGTATITVFAAAYILAACGGGNDAAGADDADDGEVASLGTTPSAGTTSDGSAPDGTESEAPEDPEAAMLAFAECMREHGIDMADPEARGDGGEAVGIAVTIGPGDEEEMEAAQEACQPLMENARSQMELDPEQQAEMQAEMLEFAQCMRDHGIDMEDPVMAEDGGVMINMSSNSAAENEPGGGQTPRDDEEFQAAAEECGRPGGEGGILTNVSEDEDG